MDVVVAGSANNFTFSVIDFTNPATPTIVQVNPGFGGASTVDAKSNFAAVGDLTGSNVALFDVTNPAAPALLGSIGTQLAGIAAISMDGMRVLAGEMNGLRAVLIDFTTPNAPVILSTFNTGISSISSIALSGTRAVAGGPNDGQLSAIDYSNPNNPTKKLFDPGLGGGLTVDLDGTMCAAGDQNGFQVALIDVSGTPTKVGTANTSLGSISSVSIVGSRVAASSPNDVNIALIDFTNPNNPTVANFNPGLNGGSSLKRTTNRLAAGDILGQGVKLFSLAGNTATLLGSANSGINSIGSVAFTSFPGNVPPPTKPKMQVSQNSFAFGSVAVCQSGSQTLTIKNIGNATLKITSITAPAPFSASPSGANNIAPGGSLSVTVKFTPTAVVSSNATLTIASNDPTTPSLGLPLSGTGTPTPPAKIAVDQSSMPFGACLVNYFIGKRITITNLSPCLPLTVNSLSTADAVFPITANDPTTLPSTTSLGPVTIPGGGSARFVVVFAPTTTGPFSATLTIKSNDPTNPTVPVLLSGTGVLAKATSIDLVLDTSGSMGDPAPGGTKIDALKSAVGLFVDLLPDSQGDFIGGVTFSDQADVLLDYAAVDAAEKATVKAAVAPLTPAGATSIGSGLNLGFDQIIFHAQTPRKVLLVFTDGMENTWPMIADVETPILQSGLEIYAVGLGSGAEIDANKLNQLAATSNGKFFASDDTLILRKNFVQVLADAFRMNMAADPVLTIAQGQTIDVKVAVTRCESRLRFVCAWDDLDQQLDLTVIAPDGTTFRPNSPSSNRLVSYVAAGLCLLQ